MRLRVIFGLASILAIAAACQLIAGIDDRTIYDGAVTESGIDPCSGPNIPQAPDPSTSSPTDNVTITAALSQVMFGSTDGGPYYGFNLDKTCTCPGPDSCKSTATSSYCDDPNGYGIDNFARRTFETLNALVPGGIITEAKFNQALATGLSGALLEVSSYNGKADDESVVVTVYASQGITGYPDAAPKFDGNDKWIIDPSSVSGQFRTTDAWVSNYTLVAINLNFPIIIGSATTQPVTISLNDGIISAQLQADGGAIVSMTGMLGGRWDPAKFLPSLQSVPDPLNSGQYLCGDSGTYQILKKIICQNTDINASPSGDNQQGSCNAVSMGLGFVASPALKGDAGATLTPITPCGATWFDDCP